MDWLAAFGVSPQEIRAETALNGKSFAVFRGAKSDLQPENLSLVITHILNEQGVSSLVIQSFSASVYASSMGHPVP